MTEWHSLLSSPIESIKVERERDETPHLNRLEPMSSCCTFIFRYLYWSLIKIADTDYSRQSEIITDNNRIISYKKEEIKKQVDDLSDGIKITCRDSASGQVDVYSKAKKADPSSRNG